MINIDHKALMAERFKRVNEAIEETGYTFNELEKKTGIPHSTLQRYVSGTTDKIPVTFYEAIAMATNKPVEYLLCFDNKKIVPETNNRDELSEVFNSLSEQDVEDLIQYAEFLKSKKQDSIL